VNRRFCPCPILSFHHLRVGPHLVIFNLWSPNYSSPTTARLTPAAPLPVDVWPHHGAGGAPPWGWWHPSLGRLRPSWRSRHGADDGDLLAALARLSLPRRCHGKGGRRRNPWTKVEEDPNIGSTVTGERVGVKMFIHMCWRWKRRKKSQNLYS
jgi:hypothetical protein